MMNNASNKITVTVAIDVPAYASIEVDAGAALTSDFLESLARSANESAVFEPNWEGAEGLRIVDVKDSNDELVDGLVDLNINSNYSDFGRYTELYLKGKMTLDQLVDCALVCKIVADKKGVSLAPVDIAVQVLNGCVSSVDVIASNYVNVTATIVDHDDEDTPNYSLDDANVRVDKVKAGNIESLSLEVLEGTLGALVKQFEDDVSEKGIFEVLSSQKCWEESSEENADEIIFESTLESDYDDGELSFILKFDRDQIDQKEIMASVCVIKVNYHDENDRAVLLDCNLYATNLIRHLIEENEIQ
jgi:hypothetical protein